MARLKLAAGTIFSIPFADGHHALGQVQQVEPFTYVAIWRDSFSSEPSAGDFVLANDLLLAGYVSNFSSKRWRLLGDSPLRDSVSRPCYVVDGPEGRVLKRFDGTVVKPASEADLAFYGRRTLSSVAVFEGALNHFLLDGENDWDYQSLLISNVAARTC